MRPELKKVQTENNDIDSLIDALIMIKSQHGNLQCFDSDMSLIDCFRIHIGDTNYDKENYPDGYIVVC